jgi:hypothetical protein
MLGRLSGSLPLSDVKTLYLDPIFALPHEACCALLSPFVEMYICIYVYDAAVVPSDAVPLLDLCLGRLLQGPAFDRTGYRSGQISGFDEPLLVRSLMFVSVKSATLSKRYVNGDWSDISRILPIVDRFVRTAGWGASVMSSFLTLCERSKDCYPAKDFADQILHVLGTGSEPLPGWHGTLLPARIAGLVQHFSQRDAPLSPDLAQRLLSVLDLLVDMGDRRSAALQLSEALREVKMP